jgi:predicted transposase YdaD
VMNRDDTLWKCVLEDLFDDFLHFYFVGAENLFDIRKGFQFLDKELCDLFPGEEMRAPKFVDKLVRVFTRDPLMASLILHIEVQGYEDPDFLERMFTYFYRVKDKYREPVFSIAILTDKDKNYRPGSYEHECHGNTASYRFRVFKVSDQEESALLSNDNPFSIVLLTVLLALKKKRRLSDQELFVQKVELAKNLLGRGLPANKEKALLTFLKLYVRFTEKEYNIKFDIAIQELTQKTETMGIVEFVLDRARNEGIDEGIQKGMEKGMERGIEEGIKKGQQERDQEFVKSLLTNTDFDIAKIAGLVNVTGAFVRKVKKSMK